MATQIWTGATNGNFGTATNWLSGTAPVNNDTVVFDRGNVDVNAGLTTGLTGLTVIGTDGYTGRIAPGANSLNAAFTSIRWAAGSGNFSGNITNGRFTPRIGSAISYASGTATNLYFGNTNVSIEAAAVVTNMRAWAAIIDDLYNATAYTLAEIAGGSQLKTKRGGKIITKAGSMAEVLDAGVLSTASEARSRSMLKYLSSAAVSGTVDVEPDALFTAQDNATAFDFSSGTLNLWPGAKYNLDTRAGTVDPGTLNVYGLSASSDVGEPISIP